MVSEAICRLESDFYKVHSFLLGELLSVIRRDRKNLFGYVVWCMSSNTKTTVPGGRQTPKGSLFRKAIFQGRMPSVPGIMMLSSRRIQCSDFEQ